MTSDDQYFLDLLSSIPNDVRHYSLEVADAIDRSVDHAAVFIRRTLSSIEWLPESARPRQPPPPPLPVRVTGSRGMLLGTRDWVSEHRALTAAVVAFVVTGGVLIYRRRKAYIRKRRARRSAAGGRLEVVVVAGNPHSPITRSVSLDLERRGFIVYMVVGTAEEEVLVKNESRSDVRSLFLDITNPFDVQDTVDKFRRMLASPHQTISGIPPQSLQFSGLVLIPDLTYAAGPVETIPPELWSDALNAKVLGTIVTAQAFLSTIREYKARIVIMTPAVMPSLQPPFHGVENAVVGALEGFTSSLRGELGTMDIDVCHFKLGAFNILKESSGSDSQHHSRSPREADVMSWPASLRAAYGRNYFSQCDGIRRHNGLVGAGAAAIGSPLRELNNAVFDALTQQYPRGTWMVGRGSLLYGMVGRLVPSGIVGWMMGVRGLSHEEVDHARTVDSVQSLQWEKVESMA